MARIKAYTPLDMNAVQFIWRPASSSIDPWFLLSYDGLNFGTYDGIFTKVGGQPVGTISSYLEDSVSRVPHWEMTGVALDATTTISLASAGQSFSIFANALKGDDDFIGSSGQDKFFGLGGKNFYFGFGGNDLFIGGDAGLDGVGYRGPSTNFTILIDGDQIAIQDRTGLDGIDAMSNILAAAFADKTVRLDWLTKARHASADQVDDMLDMYTAYFDRAPDAGGINYWLAQLVDGMALQQIAKSFFVQPETVAAYPASMTTTQFVTQVYNNALGRAPDVGGLAYWVNDLDSGAQTRDAFMLAIIYGARATTGNADDAAYLRNKGTVAEYFSLTKGLMNVDWANQVMVGVNADLATVTAAEAMIDQFVHTVETVSPQLMLPVIGVAG